MRQGLNPCRISLLTYCEPKQPIFYLDVFYLILSQEV